VFTTHCAQLAVAGLQIGVPPLHGLAVLHPTHTAGLFDVSQIDASPGQSPFDAHAAWHV
jgi:hypothetical protein